MLANFFGFKDSNIYIIRIQMGKIFIVIGIFTLLTGLLVQFFPQVFSWFGKLPGDVRYERGNFKFFFPLTTMILFSVGITILLKIFGK